MDILSKVKYDRVTDVLHPFSGLGSVHPAILLKAGERGTKAHEICDTIMDRGPLIAMDAALEGYANSFSQWAEGKKFLKKPDRFYDDELMITGECDGIYETKEGLVLLDIKTPARESKTWALQGSAYSYLAKKAGYDIQRIEFIKVDAEGKPAKVFVYEENMDLFRKVLDVYRVFFRPQFEGNILENI